MLNRTTITFVIGYSVLFLLIACASRKTIVTGPHPYVSKGCKLENDLPCLDMECKEIKVPAKFSRECIKLEAK